MFVYRDIFIPHIHAHTSWTHPTLDHVVLAFAMAELELEPAEPAVEMAGEVKKQKLKKNKMTVPWEDSYHSHIYIYDYIYI